MSQTWEPNSFQGTNVAQTDEQNQENNFATLKSCFSGTSSPSNPVEGMQYRDTTYNNWRGYNGAAWVGILSGSASFKLWVYMNAAEDGWIVDSTPSDTVLAVKGGSIYTTGGAGAGSWTVSGLSATAHNHKVYTANAVNTTGHTYDSDGTLTDVAYSTSAGVGVGISAYTKALSNPWETVDMYTENKTPAISSDASWRPAASVGILQYPDLT